MAPQLRVTVGITTLREQRQGQSRSVVGISRHPRYTTSALSFRYDAAVLTLNRPIKNTAPARIPATTANGLETPGREATVAGWGNTEKQNPEYKQPDNYPVRMQEAQAHIPRTLRPHAYCADTTTRLHARRGRAGRTPARTLGGPISSRPRGFYRSDNDLRNRCVVLISPASHRSELRGHQALSQAVLELAPKA